MGIKICHGLCLIPVHCLSDSLLVILIQNEILLAQSSMVDHEEKLRTLSDAQQHDIGHDDALEALCQSVAEVKEKVGHAAFALCS